MKIEIRWKGTPKSETLAAHVRARAGFALGRFSARVRRLMVRFEDTNGPRGGIDKRCTVEATGDFGARIFEARDADFHAAVNRALEMSSRSLARTIQRSREHAPWLPAHAWQGGRA